MVFTLPTYCRLTDDNIIFAQPLNLILQGCPWPLGATNDGWVLPPRGWTLDTVVTRLILMDGDAPCLCHSATLRPATSCCTLGLMMRGHSTSRVGGTFVLVSVNGNPSLNFLKHFLHTLTKDSFTLSLWLGIFLDQVGMFLGYGYIYIPV